ncbi:unnamed protein product [Lasius platythorax]|uniref:Uncharacterized protein n=1 Tax=Lasius platythorax TaxID=488582 RepID=A0AAV2NJX1_9HYME
MIAMPYRRRNISSSTTKFSRGSPYTAASSLSSSVVGQEDFARRRYWRDGPEVIEGDAFTSRRVIECNELLFAEQCR